MRSTFLVKLSLKLRALVSFACFYKEKKGATYFHCSKQAPYVF